MRGALRRGAAIVLLCVAGCGPASSSPSPSTPSPSTPSPSSTTETAGTESAPVAATECTPRSAEGPPPSILAATWPEAPPPERRDARGRRLIVLEEMDAYGPLHVMQVDATGGTTDLGEGSDPRLDEGAIVFLEQLPGEEATTLVRISPDGTRERRAGGTGCLSMLGGPMPFSSSPYGADGRFMAFARGCEEPGEGCAVVVHDHLPLEDEAPLDRIELDPPRRPNQLLLTEDASVVVACTRVGDAGTLLSVNRATHARATVPIAGRCLALSPSGDRVLVSVYDAPFVELITPATGERLRIEVDLSAAGAAFDACGSSAVVVGAVAAEADGGSATSALERAARIFFDGRPSERLLETVVAGPELAHVEIDARGWVLVASDDVGVPAHVFVVPLGGGTPTEWTVPGRVYDVSLGP